VCDKLHTASRQPEATQDCQHPALRRPEDEETSSLRPVPDPGPRRLAQDIVIGQSVPLSGSNADIGRDMRDGALAIFNKVNASNQLGGRKIQLVTLDNANNRQRAAENSQQLVNQGALALFGYNSATNSVDALPLVAQNSMLFLAPFSGSLSLRNHPNVYTIRASYKDETLEILESKRAVGSNKAVVVYYDDEVGRSNYEAVAGTFADNGLERPRGVAVKRGARRERGRGRCNRQGQPSLCTGDHPVQRRR